MQPHYEYKGYKVFITQTKRYDSQTNYIWFRIEDKDGNKCRDFDPALNHLSDNDMELLIDRIE